MVDGLPEKLENVKMKYATCFESKMANSQFENDKSKPTETLEKVHTNLNDPDALFF